ncbi:glycosyltransferase [Shewanella baltica]|uniref:glycosyltransferase n=1 Tax=Shewanella TaxID=22 RepID=UPI003D7A6661
MKVLWVIGSLENGGAERVLLKVVNDLSVYGIESTIFVLSNKVSLLKDIEVKATVITAINDSSSLRFNVFSVLYRLFIESKKNEVIIGALEFVPSYFSKLISLITNRKNLNWFHTRYSSYVDDMSFLNKILANAFYKRCSDIIFVSESARLDFIKTLHLTSNINRYRVIYNPITHDFPLSFVRNQPDMCDISDKIVKFLIVGRLEPVKNIIFFIDVLFLAKKLGLVFSLDIVGDGSLYIELKDKIVSLNLVDNIRLLGYKNDIANFYNDADFLIVPSIYEGFGGVVLEAYYHSLPVITFTDSGGPAELLKILDFGHASTNRDVNLFAEELIKISENKAIFNFIPQQNNVFEIKNIMSHWIALLRSL